MKRYRYSLVALALLAVLAAVAVVQNRLHRRLELANHALRVRVAELDRLRQENEGLRQRASYTHPARSAEQTRELARWRATVARLNRELAEATRSPAPNHELEPPSYETQDPELERIYGPEGRGKSRYGLDLGQAVQEYARQHQGQLPPNLNAVVPLLRAEARVQSRFTPDQFELTCQGRLEDIVEPVPEIALLLKERNAWQTPKGLWARTYVWAGGGSFIRAFRSEAAMAEWEQARLPKMSAGGP